MLRTSGELRIVRRDQRAEERADDPGADEEAAEEERRRAHEQPEALAARDLRLGPGASGIGDRGGWVVDRRHSAVGVADARVEERVGDVGERGRDEEDDPDDEHALSRSGKSLSLAAVKMSRPMPG